MVEQARRGAGAQTTRAVIIGRAGIAVVAHRAVAQVPARARQALIIGAGIAIAGTGGAVVGVVAATGEALIIGAGVAIASTREAVVLNLAGRRTAIAILGVAVVALFSTVWVSVPVAAVRPHAVHVEDKRGDEASLRCCTNSHCPSVRKTVGCHVTVQHGRGVSERAKDRWRRLETEISHRAPLFPIMQTTPPRTNDVNAQSERSASSRRISG